MFEESGAILNGSAKPDDVERWLSAAGFVDRDAAERRLQEIAQLELAAFQDVLPILLSILSGSPSPDSVLVSFERFVQRLKRPQESLQWLARHPRAVEIALRVFVTSRYLSEILLQSPDLLVGLTERRRTSEFKSREQFQSEAWEFAEEQTGDNEPADRRSITDGFRRYQQQELLRIGVCDAFGFMDLRTVTVQLSLLADGLISACLDLACRESNIETADFCVLALGKLGGEELNYSSDIDLMFVTQEAATRYWTVAQRLIQFLMEASPDGFLYRVDMRLRPWGESGALVNTVEAQLDYLKKHGAQWEMQALLKARAISGNRETGRQFLEAVQPIIFEISRADAAAGVVASKQRIEAELSRHGRQEGEVKSGEGSIRDVEFVTQYLQLVHGALHPEVRSGNTLDGIKRLTAAGLLSATEFRQLTSGYVFLRTIEHSLQLLQHRQTHTLPTDEDELDWLSSRLDFPNATTLLRFYETHRSAIRGIFDNQLGQVTEVVEARPATKSLPVDSNRKFASAIRRTSERVQASLEDSQIEMPDVVVETEVLGEQLWQVTVSGRDVEGTLSILAGLLFVYDCNIMQGRVASDARITESNRRFVDVFQVHSETIDDAGWQSFRAELEQLLGQAAIKYSLIRGQLVRRVAESMRRETPVESVLYPVQISIDNQLSDDLTVLEIRSRDTRGFLFELANALALLKIDVVRVEIRSDDSDVFDTLFVTDRHGHKLTDAEKLRELRSAIVLIKHFTHLLPRAPDPEQALNGFRELLQSLLERNLADSLASLENANVLKTLTRLLGVSPFLWQDFLRLQHENLFPVVRSAHEFIERKPVEQLEQELDAALASGDSWDEKRTALNRFKDLEMFRTDMRHILGHTDVFFDFSTELTDIVDTVIRAALQMSCQRVEEEFGQPSTALCVAALGKCGGRELGFASDIELVFLYEASGYSSGAKSISNDEYLAKIIRRFTGMIESRQEGIFQLDLRLRPYGNAGPLAVSLSAFQRYFAADGPAWPYERQAMIKLRPVAGDGAFGQRIVDERDTLIYSAGTFDRNAMRASREKQVRQLVDAGSLNVKLSPGGLVDAEYLVQALQLIHGCQLPEVRVTGTREAIEALTKLNVLSSQQSAELFYCYLMLRRIIDALRMVRGNARDLALPANDSDEMKSLTRRVRFSDGGNALDTKELLARLEFCLTRIQHLQETLLGE